MRASRRVTRFTTLGWKRFSIVIVWAIKGQGVRLRINRVRPSQERVSLPGHFQGLAVNNERGGKIQFHLFEWMTSNVTKSSDAELWYVCFANYYLYVVCLILMYWHVLLINLFYLLNFRIWMSPIWCCYFISRLIKLSVISANMLIVEFWQHTIK